MAKQKTQKLENQTESKHTRIGGFGNYKPEIKKNKTSKIQTVKNNTANETKI